MNKFIKINNNKFLWVQKNKIINLNKVLKIIYKDYKKVLTKIK